MLELLTKAQMAEADRLTIAAGTPGIDLMEAAGRAVAEAAREMTDTGPILVLAGPGNNGGDGFIAARLLAEAGYEIQLTLLGDPARLRGDAARARDRWSGEILTAGTPLPPAALIIDALFGAGLDRPLDGMAQQIVAAMNAHPAPVLCVDVPSGLDADSGQVLGTAVAATRSVTFFRRKPGHLLYPGRALTGALTLSQIGIPASVLSGSGIDSTENTPMLWTRSLPRPDPTGHKYHRGHALVLSGPMRRTGAARLAAGAALRAGAGLVTLGSPGNALAVNAAHLTAIMLARIDDPDALGETLRDTRYTALALGPGFGTGAAQREMILEALRAPAVIVLDADALTAFAEDPDPLFRAIAARAAPVILTPHDGEFARLFPQFADLPNKTGRARRAAALSGAIVVLKGADTVIASPDGRAAINSNAPAWLATAGSGDVLTGIATGLAAQGMPGFEAACAAVWMHGAAGTEAGPGLTAEDLSPALRPVIAALAARGQP